MVKTSLPRKIAILKSRVHCQGGLERYAIHVANGFAEEGHQPIILSTSEKPKAITMKLHPNVKILELGSRFRWNFIATLQFRKWVNTWLKSNEVDLVFGLDRNGCEAIHRAGNGSHRAFLNLKKSMSNSIWSHLINYNPFHCLVKHIEKNTFESNSLKSLVVNSNLVKDQILSLYSIPNEKIHVVYNGIDPLVSEPYFNNFNTHPITNSNSHKFIFIGNGYRRKGLDHILKALSQTPGNWSLKVLGSDSSIDAYINLAKQLKIYEKVQFLGSQSNLWPFYAESDTCLIGSLYDPFANVTLEALSMGLNVISSKYNGGCEILPEECRIYDPAMANSLNPLLEEVMRTGKKTKKRALCFREYSLNYLLSNQIKKIIDLSLSIY